MNRPGIHWMRGTMLMSRPMSTRPEREISSRVEDWMMKLRSSARLRLSTWVVLWKSLDMAGTSLSDFDSSAVDKIGEKCQLYFLYFSKECELRQFVEENSSDENVLWNTKSSPGGGA